MIAETSVIFRGSLGQCVEISAIEQFGDGSGYASKLGIVSGKFSCAGHTFCFQGLERFANDLRTAYERLQGEISLKADYDYDFISVQVYPGGHVDIRGYIFDVALPQQELRFAFTSDQTFLPETLRQLVQVLRELDGTDR